MLLVTNELPICCPHSSLSFCVKLSCKNTLTSKTTVFRTSDSSNFVHRETTMLDMNNDSCLELGDRENVKFKRLRYIISLVLRRVTLHKLHKRILILRFLTPEIVVRVTVSCPLLHYHASSQFLVHLASFRRRTHLIEILVIAWIKIICSTNYYLQ